RVPVVIKHAESDHQCRREKDDLESGLERHGLPRSFGSHPPQQVDSNHGVSKLLSASPTAIARRGASSRTWSSLCRPGLITILRKGESSSTGRANSSRSKSTSPGTRAVPPAR